MDREKIARIIAETMKFWRGFSPDACLATADALIAEMDDSDKKYAELVDALCSKAWAGRDRHASVLALAKRLSSSQQQLRPLELEDVALAAGYCIRRSGHEGPCNGLPRNDCFLAPSKENRKGRK
jgi:hypothetical protein